MSFEKLISTLAGFGTPIVLVLVMMSISGFAGAAALTSSLAILGGPLGMLGGITMLILLSQASKYGTEKVIKATILKILENKTQDEIFSEIDGYKIPDKIKEMLKKDVQKYFQ